MKKMELWYNCEAANWDEALPLGNGRMGAMVFSGSVHEQLALNDDTLWSGYGQAHEIPGAYEAYTRARDLSLAGNYKEAQDIIERECLGKNTQRYLPLGDLLLEMPSSHADYTDYRRSLDINDALSKLKYKANGVTYTREAFISYPAQALVIRLQADTPGALSFAARLACQLKSQISVYGSGLMLEGQADPTDNDDLAQRGMHFMALVEFDVDGGNTRANGDVFYVENANAVVIRMTWRTNFCDALTPPKMGAVPYHDICYMDMNKAMSMSYDELKAQHMADYQALYNRVDIHFEAADKIVAVRLAADPTPARLARWETTEDDPSLFALLFQYGRYLMISASRPGSMPMNLQGIWSHHFWPPWSGNYTLNINTEMNYWPAAAANLAECHEPLTAFVRTLRQTGAITARNLYHARGFAVHHNSDIWGMSTPVAPNDGFGAARWAFWPLAGGWLAAQLFNQYLYSRDEKFLRDEVWPAVRDAALFFLDVLTEDENGGLIFAPSTSPENDFTYNNEPLSVAKTATMTTAIIRETFVNYMDCDATLGATDIPTLEAVKIALSRLPAYQIGSRGELLEWSEAFPEHEPSHRHTSHLYPLYPGREIQHGTLLADACRTTLDLRGDESTGWALAWRINLFARLRDGERAFSFLKKQLRPCEGWQGGCYPNLFGAHPPFQIDSNFGAVAGMIEMLVQSDPGGTVHLLPALPRALGTGYVKGLRVMSGQTVDIEFADGKVTHSRIIPHAQFNPPMQVKDGTGYSS
ncbi:MAG: glycoside hydrolase family 95 protein [Defluviitaleaceae bacterium]|nr:glycoside hydrolase family 95 protein [Defluviitaleaceae bacterium]